MSKNFWINVQFYGALSAVSIFAYSLVFIGKPALEHWMENSQWMKGWQANSTKAKIERQRQKTLSDNRKAWDRTQALRFIPHKKSKICSVVSGRQVIGVVRCNEVPSESIIIHRP